MAIPSLQKLRGPSPVDNWRDTNHRWVDVAWIASALIATTLLQAVDANAYFLLSGSKPKCYSAEIPKESTVKIHYEAPDIVHPNSNRNSKSNKALTYITLQEKPVETLEEERLEHATDTDSLERLRAQLNDLSARAMKVAKPVSQAITDPYGSFLHTVHTSDAIVEICVRGPKLNPNNPMIFHLRIEEMEEEAIDEFQQETAEIENRIPRKTAEHHWSFLKQQLDKIEHEMHTILRETDFYRERDAFYHQQTNELNKATIFWPMLHCCILLVTGFTQANHIIGFFQQHLII